MSIFMLAVKRKFRFSTGDEGKGSLNLEDLFDIPLDGPNVCLENVARAANAKLKLSQDESFVFSKGKTNANLVLKMDIIKAVIEERLSDLEKADSVVQKKEMKEKILSILANKKDESLLEQSEEDLLKLLEKL